MQPPDGSETATSVILYGASVRSAAQSAVRGGYAVHGIDLFGDRDTLAACRTFTRIQDRDRLPALVREAKIRYPDAVAVQVSDLIGVSTADSLGLPNLKAGSPISRWASRAGCTTPASMVSGLDRPPSRWLIKPHQGTGGIGIRWRPTTDTPTTDNQTADGADTFRQPWVAGRSVGASYLADRSEVRLLGVCRSLHVRNHDNPFYFAGSFGPVAVDSATQAAIRSLGDQFANETGYQGLFNADFLIDRHHPPCLLEVNPRPTASSEVIELALRSQDPTASLIAAHLHPASLQISAKPAGICKRIVYAKRGGVFSQSRYDRLVQQSSVADEVTWADLPHDGASVEPGWPIMTLLLRSFRAPLYRRLLSQAQDVLV